jgi:hypothetical protein
MNGIAVADFYEEVLFEIQQKDIYEMLLNQNLLDEVVFDSFACDRLRSVSTNMPTELYKNGQLVLFSPGMEVSSL